MLNDTDIEMAEMERLGDMLYVGRCVVCEERMEEGTPAPAPPSPTP